MIKYSLIDGKYAVEKLGKGETVLVVDFKNYRVIDGRDMTVNTILSFVSSTDAVFFTKTEVE